MTVSSADAERRMGLARSILSELRPGLTGVEHMLGECVQLALKQPAPDADLVAAITQAKAMAAAIGDLVAGVETILQPSIMPPATNAPAAANHPKPVLIWRAPHDDECDPSE